MKMPGDSVSAGEPAVAAYKRLLKAFLDRRPSGIRQKLASALGTHKSFISQVTNPTYRVPLPAQHVPDVMRICHFSPDERQQFLAAYRAAHPGVPLTDDEPPGDGPLVVRIDVPDLGDAEKQRQVGEAIRDMAARMIALAQPKK